MSEKSETLQTLQIALLRAAAPNLDTEDAECTATRYVGEVGTGAAVDKCPESGGLLGIGAQLACSWGPRVGYGVECGYAWACWGQQR
jgi:hypothetical protein